MARTKYWDESSQTWKYADNGSAVGGGGGAAASVLAEGNYSDGTTIPLADALDGYDLIEIHVKDTYGYEGVLIGKRAGNDYHGGGVTATGGVYSSGGFIYQASVSIDDSGRLYFPPLYGVSVSSSVSLFTASSGNRSVTKIVGYKFSGKE